MDYLGQACGTNTGCCCWFNQRGRGLGCNSAVFLSTCTFSPHISYYFGQLAITIPIRTAEVLVATRVPAESLLGHVARCSALRHLPLLELVHLKS